MDLDISSNHDQSIPIYKQIYDQIRELIMIGDLGDGDQLPASRKLARELGVSRVSVTAAYSQLAVEGYIVSKVGSGTFVVGLFSQSAEGNVVERAPGLNLSGWGKRILSAESVELGVLNSGRPAIDFGFGRSFPHIFPYDIWRRLLARYLSTDDTMLSRYGSAAGYIPLREAVASYLRRMRGVDCRMDQVVIVSGIQQALDIICRLFLMKDDVILVESPGYVDAYNLFRTLGARLQPVPVDNQGLPVESIKETSNCRFAFVTPSNQFPRGGTMPLNRRLALLDWAQRSNAHILEDDYDGELRYSSHPIAALQGLDTEGRVIYLGTFSKVLFPALRLGYLVLPSPILPIFLKAKELVDRGAPTLTQAAVADFISEGHFERHLRRLRKEYGSRRKTLVEALDIYLPGLVEYSDVEAGLHVMIFLPADLVEEQIVASAAIAGVGVYPGSVYHFHRPSRPSLLLGFSGLGTSEIVEGVKRLAKDIKKEQRSS
jgi:GntR family transcriptional regulator/MocR family aminotransferase